MTTDARDAGAAAYRGFLFSDMRGFTAFAERHGNTVAAAKVAAFLGIAREAIAQHQGAVIKTEGDAIHAVFPSASSAVLCGLAIQDGAAALNAREPERPLQLGVGIHAGEAVETAEGYIGRAVNIAARLCAVARPGEVLVSSTVKGITQASIEVGFIPRGRRRLKGIQDPILVYAVTRDMTARAPRAMPSRAVIGGAVAALAVVVVAAFVGSRLFAGPGPSPTAGAAASPTGGPVAKPIELGELAIGTYASQRFDPPVTIQIADPGWIANRDQPAMLNLIRQAAPIGELSLLRVHEVPPNPCVQGPETAPSDPPTADVLAGLTALSHLDPPVLAMTNPQAMEVGGYPARRVDVTIAEGVLAACSGSDIAVFFAGDEVWRAASNELFRLVSVDLGDGELTIVMRTGTVPTVVEQLEALDEYGMRVLNTLELGES